MAKKLISSKIVCDTNVFINYLQNEAQTVSAVNQLGNESIIMPIISAMELCKGAGSKKELNELQEFISYYPSLQLNSKGSELALEFLKK